MLTIKAWDSVDIGELVGSFFPCILLNEYYSPFILNTPHVHCERRGGSFWTHVQFEQGVFNLNTPLDPKYGYKNAPQSSRCI